MNELRWILLAAGLLLIAAIYAWGLRARRRAAAPEHERMTRVEPARTVPVVPEPADAGPGAADDEGPPEVEGSIDAEEFDAEPVPRPTAGRGRREPRLEPLFDESADVEPPTIRLEPRLEAKNEPRLEPQAGARSEPRFEPAGAPAPEPPRKPAPQKIVAVRVVATAGSQFSGEQLLDAIEADGFTFGRYQIFHRLDPLGRAVLSLASLREPGTFDPATMAGAAYAGVAIFAVLPGPVAAQQAFEELLAVSRSLAGRLGGHMQDERGVPLTAQRVARLREEMLAFDRGRADSARR